jgi:amino acid adenylation domain-containing protein
VLLARHAGSDDIVIGTPVANRTQKELEGLIGFFVNTLVLRSDCSGNPSFIEHLARTRAVNLDAQANQDVPFEHLVERLKPARSAQHGPLFQIMFSMDTNKGGDVAALRLADLRFEPLATTALPVKFDLILNASEGASGLSFSLDYNRDLYDAATIGRMAAHYTNLLQAIVANPAAPIGQLAMLPHAEQVQLLQALNDTAVDYPHDTTLHALFEAQAARAPRQVALVFDGAAMTYAELNERANLLAHHLRAQGVGIDTPVGLCVGRGLELVIGLLAVLKAGGAYVPLDPGYPSHRLAYMVADSGIELLLTQSNLLEQLSSVTAGVPGLQLVALDTVDLSSYAASKLVPLDADDGHALAYVIYTSGSTGQPKGVMVEHRGVVNLAQFQHRYFALSAASRVLAFASPSFDAAVFEWTMALLAGATLYVCTEQQRHDAQALEAHLVEQRITHATLPPALLPALDPQRDYALQHLILAGEAFSLASVAGWQSTCQVHNAYGPTEATVCATATVLRPGDSMSIGRAIDNFQLFVLDACQALAPLGAIG